MNLPPDTILIRLPRPLYMKLLKWPDINEGETVNEIIISNTDEQNKKRVYRLVPTVYRQRLEKKS